MLEGWQVSLVPRLSRKEPGTHCVHMRLIKTERPSVTARIFICRLGLLSKVSKEGETIGCHIFSESSQDSLRLVQECRAMEGRLVSNGVTDSLLSGMSNLRVIKKGVLQVDWLTCITEASRHSSTILASQIASKMSWLKL